MLNNDYKGLLKKFHASYFQKLIIVYCKRRNLCFTNSDELIRQFEKEVSELLKNKEKRKYLSFSDIPDIVGFNYSKFIKERKMRYIIDGFTEGNEGLYFTIILSDGNSITDYFREPMRATPGIFFQRSYVMSLLIQPNKQITIMGTYSIDLSSQDVSYSYLLTPEENEEAIKRKILGVEY